MCERTLMSWFGKNAPSSLPSWMFAKIVFSNFLSDFLEVFPSFFLLRSRFSDAHSFLGEKVSHLRNFSSPLGAETFFQGLDNKKIGKYVTFKRQKMMTLFFNALKLGFIVLFAKKPCLISWVKSSLRTEHNLDFFTPCRHEVWQKRLMSFFVFLLSSSKKFFFFAFFRWDHSDKLCLWETNG